jgi:hypothetical protein
LRAEYADGHSPHLLSLEQYALSADANEGSWVLLGAKVTGRGKRKGLLEGATPTHRPRASLYSSWGLTE